MEQNSIEISQKYLLKGHQGAIYSLAQGANPYEFFSGGADRKLIQWNLKTGEGKLLANAGATIMSILLLSEQNLLLIGQTEGGVHLIDLEARKEIKLLKGHDSYIFDMIYIKEKEELIFSCADGSFSVWSAKTFERLFFHQLSDKKLRKLDYHSEMGLLAVSRGDDKLSLLNISDYSLNSEIEHNAPINVSRFSADGSYLLIGDKMAHLSKLNLKSLLIESSVPAHYWAIYDIAFSSEGNQFATASRDKIVKIWDASNFEVIQRIEGMKQSGHTHSVNALHWPMTDLLVSAGDDSSIRVWEVKS